MAAGVVKTKAISVFVVCCLFVLATVVPFCATVSIQIEEVHLTVPHHAVEGHVLLKHTNFRPNCTDTSHIHSSQIVIQSNFVSVNSKGTLVIASPLSDGIGDRVIIQQKTSSACSHANRRHKSDTTPKQIHVEIVNSEKSLRFVHDSYNGKVDQGSVRGTQVSGLSDLYACSYSSCRNNLEYRIHGSSDFYLQTTFLNGHITLEVLTKDSFMSSSKRVHNLIIIVENSDGQTGHTSVHIRVNPFETGLVVPHPDTLHFEKRQHLQRHKRQTVEPLDSRQVNETATGVLFDISQTQSLPAGQIWSYSLLESTLDNAVAVSASGLVSVATGYKLDYEAMTANGGSPVFKFNVKVTQLGNGADEPDQVVKELQQTIEVLDVNDENPVFINRPKPFLATMSPGDADGTLLYTLTAQDPDAGAQLVLAPSTEASENDYFTITVSGNKAYIYTKTLTGNQQITANQELRVVVMATDSAATPVQSTLGEVLIRAGSRPPQFYEQSYDIEFQENNADNQVLTPAIEVKSFQQNPVTCAVYTSSSQISNVFSARSESSNNNILNRCSIIVKRVFDYEAGANEYNMTVVATEVAGSNRFTSSVQVAIRVTNQNEFAPRFSLSTYKKEGVLENIAIGTPIITVTVKDDDFNSQITLYTDNDNFNVTVLTVDPATGIYTAEIRSKQQLDYDSLSPPLYDFKVLAVDNDPVVELTGLATVRVFMVNLNDEAPKFDPDMNVETRFDTDINSEIFRVQALDGDGDGVTYKMNSGANGKFAIDANSGRISTTQIIATDQASIVDFEYHLVVVATDDGECCGGTNFLSSTGTVTVYILTDNINRPTFPQCASYDPKVAEEESNAFVIQVTATDPDYGKFGNVTYSIREPNSQFSIDSETGRMTTNAPINREALIGTTRIPVNVIATDGGNLQGACALLVEITDINDNSPQFSQDGYSVNVLKGLSIGDVAVQVEATDMDIGANADVKYYLVENPEKFFRIDDTSRLTGAIKVNKSLSNEEGKTFNLVVRAEDSGAQPLHTNVSVALTVVANQNELPPQFVPGDYTVSVNESLSIGSSLMTLSADSQNPLSTSLSFLVVPSDTIFEAVADIGDGNAQTQVAQLKIKDNLDYETTKQYIVTVRATNTKLLSTDQRVIVNVIDTNDKVPEFPGVNPETNYLDVQLPESDYSGPAPRFFVGKIIAKDGDGTSPNNQIVAYHLLERDDYQDFSIVNGTGEFYTTGVFDREDPAGYVKTLFVEAVDGAPSSLNDHGPNIGVVQVKITITDVNDNAPQFTKALYQFSAKEDLRASVNVQGAQVKAVDPDSDAVLSYSIVTNPAPPFQVQSATGQIKVAATLDYDKGPKRYDFVVKVSDTKFENFANVTIVITDVNDNPPVVGDYSFSNITENRTDEVGPILLMRPSDLDNDGINFFYFKLLFTDPNDAQYFSITGSGESAMLRIVKPLDRDYPNGKSEFIITVEVADERPGENELYGYGIVSIKPIDVNDNAPNLQSNLMTVMENKPANTLLDKVQFIDYDEGLNQQFTVNITSQSPQAVFTLNPQDLYISTTAELDRETVDRYIITLEAYDEGTPPLTGTGTVTVSVLDTNDNSPYFLQNQYTFTFSENVLPGGEVGRIKAVDNDTEKNAEITYSLDDADNILFRIDQDLETAEGVLVIFKRPDYDDVSGNQRNFNLTAYAEDIDPGVNKEKRSITYIELIVEDYNDEVPKFNPDKKNTTVAENVPVGTELAKFTATDDDIYEEYRRFEYFIQQNSDPNNQFAIDSQGRVTVKHSLDRETIAIHLVIILAIDNPDNNPQNTGSATLTVTLLDINDNFPRFIEDYLFTLMEGEDFDNSEIGTLFLVDDDLNPNPNDLQFSFFLDCSYSNASQQCSKFTIISNAAGDNGRGTATLYVTGRFDREAEKKVLLPFRLCDGPGLDQMCGYQFLDITILDVNDNKHKDGVQDIIVFNYKGSFGNIEIGKVNENDPDDGVQTDKIFELLNTAVAGLLVEVDQNTGKITLKDNVPEMSFTVKVRVTDQQPPIVTRTTTVNVQIVFITDDAVFNSGSVRINGITPEEFLYKPLVNEVLRDSMYDKFRDRTAKLLFRSNSALGFRDNVQLLTVLPADNGKATDVRFAAHGSPYYQDSKMNGIVTMNKTDFNNDLQIMKDGRLVTGEIGMVPIDMCQFETCEGGCFNELLVTDTPVLVNTPGSSFVGVNAYVNGSCGCRAKDFSGGVECEPGYCYHGGNCSKDDWGVVSCECPQGYEGPRCQILRQSFDGTGYAMYKPLEQCENSRTSIEILTNTANSLIMYNGPLSTLGQTEPQDFILLELINGYPKLRINHGTGEKAVEITGNNRKRLDDGIWHKIDIYRDLKKVRLVVDNCDNSIFSNGVENRSNCEGKGLTGGENIYLNVDDLLQLGGRYSSPSYPQGVTDAKFNGCMKNFVHNAEIYDLSTEGTFPGSEDGCTREDNACDPKCSNGQCLITGKDSNNQIQAMCDCNEGYRESTSGSCDLATTIRDMQSYSYMDWALKSNFANLLNSRTNRVSFHFRTRDQDGVMFSISDKFDSNKYVTVRMTDSHLRITYNLGDNPNFIQLSDIEAANGQWHKVVMERSGKEFVLKMDSGEGRYYVDTPGPAVGNVDFTVKQNQMYSGSALDYSSATPSIVFDAVDDFNSSCVNDVRFEYNWFPMQDSEDANSIAANFETQSNTVLGCTRNDCPANKCRAPFVCVPLWESFDCVCPEHFIKDLDNCIPIDYCTPNPCFGLATCAVKDVFVEGQNYFNCTCTGGWYGPLCQCHSDLNSGGQACLIVGGEDEVVAMAGAVIAGIVVGIVLLIALIVLLAIFLYTRCRSEKSNLISKDDEDDYDDDIRENIMFYDEEGAGEEDQTTYDLSRLRKPDDGEGPGIWDAPDIRKINTNPLGAAGERPDVGDFIDSRLQDADNDPNAPPYEFPQTFEMEGGGSDAGSLSSLNTSSSGSQDYDYLNEWGPKFAKLADMYNNYDESE